MTPEGKAKPGIFKDSSYLADFAKIASEVEERVAREIGRLNAIVEQELVHLRTRFLPNVSARLAAATQLWQQLMSIVNGVGVSAPQTQLRSSTPSSSQSVVPQAAGSTLPTSASQSSSLTPSLDDASHAYHHRILLDHQLLQLQCSDAFIPHELRKCSAEVLHLTRLECAAKDRMRRLCGIRDGSTPRDDAPPVKMRLMMCTRVDSSNNTGVLELKSQLAFHCHGLPFIGERVPKVWTKVDEALDKLQQQSLTAPEACREILKVMESPPQGSLSAVKSELTEGQVLEALEFWSQLGRLFMQEGQVFPKPQLVVDLIRPLVHHKPMNLLSDTERLGLLKKESLMPGALHTEAQQHLQHLAARNEVHEEFLKKHVTSWAKLSQEQVSVMLKFFVSCALLSDIGNQGGIHLVTARLRNLPGIQQLASPAADAPSSPSPAVASSAADLSREMQERLEISAAKEDMTRGMKKYLQHFMQPSHCAMQVMPLILGTSDTSDHKLSPTLRVRANEAFVLLPIHHIAVLARLQARIVQTQPGGISLHMHMFNDGVVISRGESLCAVRIRSWSPNERSPKLRDRVFNLECILHLVSNDYGMFRFMSRCIEGIVETAFAGLRYECWCPIRDDHGNTVDWMQFQGCGGGAVTQSGGKGDKSSQVGERNAPLPPLFVQDSLSTILEEKNLFDVIFDGRQLHQLFAICSSVFISHAWNDGTFLFVKRLKHYLEMLALVNVWCDYQQLDQRQGEVEVQFRNGLCKASVILVCLTPRYLTRPNCLRELKWSLDFAYKTEKDVRILPLHPALTFPGISKILQCGCVCVSNANGTHKVHKLSALALELVSKIKQNMCLNWSDLQPWASDALGDSWPEKVLAADGTVRASMVTGSSGSPVGLVNELVSKISGMLGFNDKPSPIGDCKELEDKDLEASDVLDLDVPAGLLDGYPEISPEFRKRVQDCADRNTRLQDAIKSHSSASIAAIRTATISSPAAQLPSLNIQEVFVKSKSHKFPALTQATRYRRHFMFFSTR